MRRIKYDSGGVGGMMHVSIKTKDIFRKLKIKDVTYLPATAVAVTINSDFFEKDG